MHVSQFTIPSFKGPFLTSFEVLDSYIVNDDIVDESVSTYTDFGLCLEVFLRLVREEVFFHDFEAVKFLNTKKIVQILKLPK